MRDGGKCIEEINGNLKKSDFNCLDDCISSKYYLFISGIFRKDSSINGQRNETAGGKRSGRSRRGTGDRKRRTGNSRGKTEGRNRKRENGKAAGLFKSCKKRSFFWKKREKIEKFLRN